MSKDIYAQQIQEVYDQLLKHTGATKFKVNPKSGDYDIKHDGLKLLIGVVSSNGDNGMHKTQFDALKKLQANNNIYTTYVFNIFNFGLPNQEIYFTPFEYIKDYVKNGQQKGDTFYLYDIDKFNSTIAKFKDEMKKQQRYLDLMKEYEGKYPALYIDMALEKMYIQKHSDKYKKINNTDIKFNKNSISVNKHFNPMDTYAYAEINNVIEVMTKWS